MAPMSKSRSLPQYALRGAHYKAIFLQLVLLLCCSFTLLGQTKDNEELKRMFDEDVRARSASKIDWSVLSRQDSLRAQRIYQLIKEEKLITATDHYHAALIFQHGLDTDASAMAVQQMRKAIELDTTINRWLLAAAIDRDLMRRELPQIYGTQYEKKGENGKWEQYEIDTTQVSDAERIRYGVETLAEQRVKLHNMNLVSVSAYYAESNSMDKTIRLIRSQVKQGKNARYNVSESALNSFGYELMADDKKEEALKIFKLNTELYPTGYNAFDSYGECLLALNRKAEGLKAYRKSLELNPQNSNARKILADGK